MPFCYGYTTGDPQALHEYYLAHLAIAFEFGGIFTDPDPLQPLATREQYYGLQQVVARGDLVLLSSLNALYIRPKAVDALHNWNKIGAMVLIHDTGAIVNGHTSEGRNARAIITSLRSLREQRRSRYANTPSIVNDPRIVEFKGWGVKRTRRNGKWVWIADTRTREAMKLIVKMRDRGTPWRQIGKWLRAHGYTRDGRTWVNATAVEWAYKKEMRFRALEAEVAQGKESCAPSAIPESAPTNKPEKESA